jgi:large subunit ribosomal protein L30e
MIIYLPDNKVVSVLYRVRSICKSDIFMADLSNDIRLAVDSGEAAIGVNKAIEALLSNRAKMVIVASKNKGDRLSDIQHLAKISNTKIQIFEGTPMDLGVVCGKPFSVSVLSIIDAGNSNILKETETSVNI